MTQRIRKPKKPGSEPFTLGRAAFAKISAVEGIHVATTDIAAKGAGSLMDLDNLTPSELLALHARVADELRLRAITRSANNPTGDLAEHLFCKAFGWKQAGNSSPNVDAEGSDGTRYQIKGRRLTKHNGSRQLSAIRELDGKHFHVLAGVLFRVDYSVLRAALIPYDVVVSRASFVKHTNSHKFFLRDDIWSAPGVLDVTGTLRAVSL